jgi:hypothetical protein
MKFSFDIVKSMGESCPASSQSPGGLRTGRVASFFKDATQQKGDFQHNN